MKTDDANRKIILIVDDDPVQLQILIKTMEKSGYQAIGCNDGEEALKKLKEVRTVDLIITDLYMPKIDGWKLCRLLRSVEFAEYNKIPILVISATFSGSDAEEITRELGANGFLAVPYNPGELRSTVKNLLLGKTDKKKSSVLIVDDDDGLRETMRDAFKEHGYEVCEAADGEQARSMFEQGRPEIVILDYHLPGQEDGAHLIEAFKTPQNQVAVLAITGDPDPDLAVKVTQMGADAFVHKPFKMQYLFDLCAKVRREWALLRVETLLEDRTLELRRILETSVDGIMIADSSDCIVQVNNAVEMMLGYNREELVGKYLWELIPDDEEHHNKVRDVISDLKKKERVSGVEQVWRRKDGELFYVEVNFSIIKDIKSNAAGSLACIRDINDRKRAEEELRRSEERYHSLVENANDAIISTDKTGKIISFNKKAEQMFGYTRDEILGNSVVLLSPKNARERQERMFEEFSRTNTLYIVGKTLEGKGLRKDGQEFFMEGSTYIIEVGGESILTVLIRDISDRKGMEERLLVSEKLKSLGELAGGVAHNFNNILAIILGRTQLLRRNAETPPDKKERRKLVQELIKSLDIIEKASFDGADTVRRIQEFSRKKSEDYNNKNFTDVDLNEVINSTLEFTKVKWQDEAVTKGVKINIIKELDSLAPVAGNPSELREVFINLINNAVDALPEGGTVTVKTFMENGNVVTVIEDTGVGISKDVQDKIFDPFFTTKGVQATGLGMSVSYGIINRHQGTIALKSSEGQGTSITIKIPKHDGAVHEQTREEPLPEDRKKATILVVEDEEDVRELLKDILTDGGHAVEFTPDGKKGIELFQQNKFDMVFTDLGMPGMSGWQVAEQIKKINKNTPVVLITGWEVQEKGRELKKSGVDMVVKKPFRVNEILELVQNRMERTEEKECSANIL
jgi:PAS domain S-box-containing protein